MEMIKMAKKKMLLLQDLVQSWLDHGETIQDTVDDLGFEIGTLLACHPEHECFETVLHEFISKIYRGKKYWEETQCTK
tara:strand:- start:18522 stop:18755 length:234 start_codon:yes stop_codon:yes gene_type:complete